MNVADAQLGFTWLVATLVTVAIVGFVFPFQTWWWGLLLGAGIGGSTILTSVWSIQVSGQMEVESG